MHQIIDFYKRHPVFTFGTAVSGLIMLLHLVGLARFPVFADESIYIRWAQLIHDDWMRYLFFPLNDGKTPLFMWLVALAAPVYSDQLVAARLVSVIAGAVQIGASIGLMAALGGSKRAQMLTALMSAILPYWFFHHHLALIDGLLTMFLTLTAWAVVKLNREVQTLPRLSKPGLIWLTTAAFFWGCALITKVPAIVAAPGIVWLAIAFSPMSQKRRLQTLVVTLSSLAVGSLMFVGLKIHPAFGQLFSRGSDFLFPIDEVLTGGYVHTIGNFPSIFWYFWQYLTPPFFLLLVAALFSKSHQRTILVLVAAGCLFILPIALLGRVVFARYLLPAMLFFTPAIALGIDNLLSRAASQKSLWKRAAASTALVILLANGLTQSLYFAAQVVFNPDSTPFVESDRQQYLLAWSSGHGIREVVAEIQNAAATHTVAVATEGFFGTLPDAILLFLHQRDVSNIYVEGIGLPILGVPDSFAKRAVTFDQTLLVVNSHRLSWQLPADRLLHAYCRPDPTAPCLQLWDITGLMQQPN